MVQGSIKRQPKQVKQIDVETLREVQREQQRAINETTSELYRETLMTHQPLPRAADFSWCMSSQDKPEKPSIQSQSQAQPSTSGLPAGHPPITPATLQKPTHRLVCYYNFGNDFYERMQLANSVAASKGLMLQQTSRDEQQQQQQPSQSTSSESDRGQTTKVHGGLLDGRYVLTLRGTESYVQRASKWAELPPELFVLLGETGFNKVRIQKEITRQQGQDPTVTLNRFVLVSMADVWDNSSRGMRNHLHRIYSPGWNNIKKLPEFFQSGTPWEFAKRTVDIVKEGKPLDLAQRMLESTGRVLSAYAEKQKSDRENGGSGGGNGRGGGGGSLGPPGGGGGEAV